MMVDKGLTVTVTLAVPEQPPSVAVTEYVVVPVGVTVTEGVVAVVLHV